MTATVSTAVCARCQQSKPAEDFRPNKRMHRGVDSWCNKCHLDYQREYQARRPRQLTSEALDRAAQALKEAEAIDYSRAVCEHIEWFVGRKITEFESRHGIEAPPHLTAIMGLARSLAAQHPATQRARQKWKGEIQCKRCGQTVESRSPTRQYCDACRTLNRHDYRTQTYVKAIRNAQKRRRSKLRGFNLVCKHCGKPFVGKSKNRKFCSAECVDASLPQRRGGGLGRAKINPKPATITCERCGDTVITTIGPGRPPKYCFACRAIRDREQRRDSKLRRLGKEGPSFSGAPLA